MFRLIERIRALGASEDGPTVTEYAVILGLIILISIGALNLLGTKVSSVFAGIHTALPTG